MSRRFSFVDIVVGSSRVLLRVRFVIASHIFGEVRGLRGKFASKEPSPAFRHIPVVVQGEFVALNNRLQPSRSDALISEFFAAQRERRFVGAEAEFWQRFLSDHNVYRQCLSRL